ncbi:Gfo/Idh/MocA family oxidoreductase [Cetobacterium sp. 8H]|uniref:Gfo/Idh/MocA family protein n=1 Tax=Cetobacterium sp. 8H TaxID=2759681 RepID=UPI00163CC441|nr:Gfo/Idh/MocA family oxidoreductase [Cetobacterium sp. 8H]MBC2850918.1 Gfo/Idh/MocA family oxidoreductase [Cetobacterium sp. 8H]
MTEVRWGMIGTGEVTEVKSGPGLYKARNSKLVAVTGVDLEQVKDYAKRHNVEKVFLNPEELIKSDLVNAVYIATPPKYHKYYALKSIEAKKDVYIEKPIATTFEECLEIKEAAERNNVKVFTAFYRRGMEKFKKIKELVDLKKIGDVRYVDITLNQQIPIDIKNGKDLPWRFKKDISGGGIFLDMGIHTIDILDYIIGPIKNIQSLVKNQGGYYDVEDIVTTIMDFENGVIGIGKWCFSTFEWKDEVIIVGSEGKIEFSCFNNGNVKIITHQGIEEFIFADLIHVQQPYIQEIVNELLSGKKHSGSLESSIRAQEISDEVLKKYNKN